MNRTSVLRTSTLLGLFALPIAACASPQGDDSAVAVSSESELRQLDASEIVGTIAYGETKTVAYTEETRYRAFSFTAAEGDEIDARFVGANTLDPIGFLLDQNFKTLAQNDDESSTSDAAHVTYKMTKAGKYYLAVREANEEAGQLTVSLAKVGSTTPRPDDPFDPASCTGSPMTNEQALAHFSPGAMHARLGTFDILQRSRTCNAATGCTKWSAPSPAQGPTSFGSTLRVGGTAFLDNHITHIRLSLTGLTDCDIGGGQSSCKAYRFEYATPSYPVTFRLQHADGNDVHFSGIVTNSCIRLTDQSESDNNLNQDQHTETEYVLFGRFPAPAN